MDTYIKTFGPQDDCGMCLYLVWLWNWHYEDGAKQKEQMASILMDGHLGTWHPASMDRTEVKAAW